MSRLRVPTPFALLSLLALVAPAPACSSSDAAAAADGPDAGAGDAAADVAADAPADAVPTTKVGCAGQDLLPLPDDPGVAGPWPVGAKTVTVAGLTTEVWYPATPGSEAGVAKVTYDIREHLPAADRAKISDAENPLQPCDCYRGLPIDDAHGPYPVVVFVHGTASFRTQSASIVTHWASRGFVVLAADHPGIQLADILALVTGGTPSGKTDQVGDANELVDALGAPSGELAFLAGRIDASRLGMSGHSAGGAAVAGFGGRAEVVIPMAAGGVAAGAKLVSSLAMGGSADGIVPFASTSGAFATTPKKKRLAGLEGAGHLVFTDICELGRDRGGILAIAQKAGVAVPGFIATLAQDGCKPGQLTSPEANATIWPLTSAVLEETLMCNAGATARLAAAKTSLSHLSAYEEEL